MIQPQQQCIKYRIYGRVQGVGFRYSVWCKANQLNLTGYVRNLADGSVETLACGASEQLEKLFSWFNAGGPRYVRVDNVFSAVHKPTQHWTTFSIRY